MITDSVLEGYTLRPGQEYALGELETYWNDAEVFAIQAPTGAGKSLLARTLASWREKHDEQTAIITPQVQLQDQYADEFPDLPVVKGKHRHECSHKEISTCDVHDELLGRYCIGCPYEASKRAARSAPTAIYNFYTYLLHEGQRETLIVDEAHNLIDCIAEFSSLKLWHHKDPALANIETSGDLLVWLEREVNGMAGEIMQRRTTKSNLQELLKMGQDISMTEFAANNASLGKLVSADRKYRQLMAGIKASSGNFFLEQTTDSYRGETKPLLRVRPVNIKYVPHALWPQNKVKRIILMSATISRKDVEMLGLANRKVRYINCPSAIPPENRPIKVKPVGSMSYRTQDKTLPKMAKRILELAEQHKGEKGVVHCTYGIAWKLREHLTDRRFLWHNRESKLEVYEKFRASEGDEILIASGMSEGIDLVEDAGRWQVLTKVMYPSLADPLIKHKMQEDQDWYDWMTARTLIQQLGRICRTPKDYGITYILDSSFVGFYRKTRRLWPDYVVEAMK